MRNISGINSNSYHNVTSKRTENTQPARVKTESLPINPKESFEASNSLSTVFHEQVDNVTKQTPETIEPKQELASEQPQKNNAPKTLAVIDTGINYEHWASMNWNATTVSWDYGRNNGLLKPEHLDFDRAVAVTPKDISQMANQSENDQAFKAVFVRGMGEYPVIDSELRSLMME